jgi:hypothetical protein
LSCGIVAVVKTVSVISINFSKAPADPSKAGISFNARLKFRVDIIPSSELAKRDEKSKFESELF